MRVAGRAAAAALSLTLLAGCGGGSSGPSPSTTGTGSGSTPTPTTTPVVTYTAPPAQLPAGPVQLSTKPPPWLPPAVVNGGAKSGGYVAAAGFVSSSEMLTVHYHAHLDVIANGKPVTVPPYLGFVAKGRRIVGLAPLHTHDASGIVHIENSVPAKFLLGQLFVEWGVRLSAHCIGGLCADRQHDFAVFVDGRRYTGDPNRIVFARHQEIAIEFGPKGKLPKPPSSYRFPAYD
jgi:hypothetical protein